jgi:hypothetical protein
VVKEALASEEALAQTHVRAGLVKAIASGSWQSFGAVIFLGEDDESTDILE